MAQDSWPSPTHNTRNVTDAEWEQMAARYSDDGVYGTPADDAVISAGVGLQVAVRANVRASVRGHAWTSGTTGDTLSLGANASGSTRIDSVVLRLDRATWNVRAIVLAGTPGAGAPALSQDQGETGEWDVWLANVTVLDGATSGAVVRREQYVGSRIRSCLSPARPLHPASGDVIFETNSGRWRGWTGSSWTVIHEDSGDVAIGGQTANWETVAANIVRKIGPMISARIWVRRTNVTMAPLVAGGTQIGVLPETFWPDRTEAFAVNVSGGSGTATIQIDTDGQVRLIENSASIPVGRTVFVSCVYLKRV